MVSVTAMRSPRVTSRSGVAFVTQNFEELGDLWKDRESALAWACPFVLPWWLQSWWESYGDTGEPWIGVGRETGGVVGVAPLLLRGAKAQFLGSEDVCDYGDFVIAKGREIAFFDSLFEELRGSGIETLDLAALRLDARSVTGIGTAARRLGLAVSIEEIGVSYEMPLPSSWEAYLGGLDKKQRHEVRRKLRRLHEQTRRVDYRAAAGCPEMEDVETFFRFFRASRADKEAFLTPRAEVFFRKVMARACDEQMLHLGFLDLDGTPSACVLCFEIAGTRYLYNNGYDPELRDQNVGLLSKVAAIREAIDIGMKRFDFLKGAEPYKHRLGGRAVPLLRYEVELR